MNTVFIGGSRHVSRLPAQVKERLDNVISNGHRIIVGDANGADKAVQKHFHEMAYEKVTVFCSGDSYRNNLGQWETHNVHPPKHLKGFHFYAAKDREMAREADFGLMIWDGKSPGTILNVLRLIRAGKKAVLFNVPEKKSHTIKTTDDWDAFLSRCSAELLNDLRDRATPDEWIPALQTSFPDMLEEAPIASSPKTDDDLATTYVSDEPLAKAGEDQPADLNAALATGNPATVLDALGSIAKARGMSQVAKESGLARESLYRALSPDGNPEFATVIKVLACLGYRLEAHKGLKAQAHET